MRFIEGRLSIHCEAEARIASVKRKMNLKSSIYPRQSYQTCYKPCSICYQACQKVSKPKHAKTCRISYQAQKTMPRKIMRAKFKKARFSCSGSISSVLQARFLSVLSCFKPNQVKDITHRKYLQNDALEVRFCTRSNARNTKLSKRTLLRTSGRRN